MTNKEYAETSENFKMSCRLCNIKATTRQASKFRNGKGAVYKITVLKQQVHVPESAIAV